MTAAVTGREALRRYECLPAVALGVAVVSAAASFAVVGLWWWGLRSGVGAYQDLLSDSVVGVLFPLTGAALVRRVPRSVAGWILVEVADDGRGFGADTVSGVGLVSMYDRASEAGGTLSVLQASEVTVLAAVGDAESALSAVRSEQPDVVLMDLALPGVSGLAAIRRLAADNPEVAVLVLTMNEDQASVFAALRAGARGYLIKNASGRDIVRAVQAVARGDAILGGQAAQQVLGPIATGATPGPPPLPQLTVRERAVLDLVARGYDNLRVARELFISDKTVRNTLTTILAKLPAASRAEAVARARDAGLGVPE